jgi:hypothetical protein
MVLPDVGPLCDSTTEAYKLNRNEHRNVSST